MAFNLTCSVGSSGFKLIPRVKFTDLDGFLESSYQKIKGLIHVTLKKPVNPIIYIVANVCPLHSEQILVDGMNQQ